MNKFTSGRVVGHGRKQLEFATQQLCTAAALVALLPPSTEQLPPTCTCAHPISNLPQPTTNRWLEFALLNCYGSWPTPGVNFFTNPTPAPGNVALAVTQTCKK